MQRMEVPIQTFLSLVLISGTCAKFIKVCYFPSWARNRTNEKANMDIDDIDPFMCTHLVWAFGGIDVKMRDLRAVHDDEESKPGFQGRFENFTDLKEKNSKLKTLLSIGGQYVTNQEFSDLYYNRRTFAKNVVKFLKSRKFDGLDIDWEYPSKEQKTANVFVELLQVLYKAFADDGGYLTLSVAMAAVSSTIQDAYDIRAVHPHVHFLSLKTYDYHGPTSKLAAFNSPLYKRHDFNETLCVNWTVNHYLHECGVPPSKIVVGFTWVGRRLVLNDKSKYMPGSRVTGEFRRGDIYDIPNGLAYPEICEMREKSGAKRYWDKEQSQPYLVYDDNFVGYEDAESIAIKIEWMFARKLAGIMVWTLDLDDHTGEICKEGKNSLFSSTNKAIKKYQDGDGSHGDNAPALHVSLSVLCLCCVSSLLRL